MNQIEPISRPATEQSGERRQREGRIDGAERRTYRQDHYIFREGETGDLAFVVLSGAVQIIKQSGDEQVVVATITQGGIFGEMALIEDKPRMASARVADDSVELLIVDRRTFQAKLNRLDPFTRGLMKILSSNVRSATDFGLGHTKGEVLSSD